MSKVCQDKLKKLNIDSDEKIHCDLCDRSYGMNTNLVAHINWKHKDREAYKCGICEFLNMKKTHGQDE